MARRSARLTPGMQMTGTCPPRSISGKTPATAHFSQIAGPALRLGSKGPNTISEGMYAAS